MAIRSKRSKVLCDHRVCRTQVENISRRVDVLKVDGIMQLLKKEVEAVNSLARCMDAFTNNHTRLVVIVDGLDSCEQDKLLQVLDMVGLVPCSLSSYFIGADSIGAAGKMPWYRRYNQGKSVILSQYFFAQGPNYKNIL